MVQLFSEVLYFHPSITYQYNINGGTISKNRWVSSKGYEDKLQAQKIVDDLVSRKRAYVNQDNADESTLVKPTSLDIFYRWGGIVGAGVLLGLVAIFFALAT